MKLVVGLGNPGDKYVNNRHNTGFILVDRIVRNKGLAWKYDKKFIAEIAREGDILYVKPQTSMNNSGDSVRNLVGYYDVDIREGLLVIHDDVDLNFGEVKKQCGRGSAGHKGVEDIIQKLGSQDFWRFRIGVGKPLEDKIETESWVLMNFEKHELKLLDELNLGI